ncbi:MAG: ABC transporter substrate-binding protein, partial [Desulfobacteria bacterium]
MERGRGLVIKMRCLRGLLFVGFMVLLILQGNLAYSKEARGVTKDLIKIGVIVDLTGPTSNAGVVMVEAYKNHIRHINDEGGIHGRKIKLIMEDDRYSIPAGISAFKKLLFKDQVLALLGPVSVGETKVLFRHIEKEKIPTLPWAPDESVMKPYKRYVFPTSGFYDNEWGVTFDYIINKLKPKNPKVALCYPDVESGKVVRDLAEEWARFFGLKLHLEVVPLSAIDVTSQVLGMKRAGVTHILIHHVAPGAAAVLKDMKKFDLDVPLFGTSAACTEDVIRIGGEASKNFVGASPYSSWYEESPGMTKVREISMKYNPGAEKSYKIKSYTMGWVIPEILCEGLS